MTEQLANNFLELTTQVVIAHLSHNQMSDETLPSLIQSVYRALSTVGQPEITSSVPQAPAVPIKKSVFPDFIVCLEDGKKLKMLKRHLQTSYGMSPDQYRAKWELPRDYPMVAPNYASTRSNLAKQIGLGRKPVETPAEPTAPTEPVATQMPARRARGSRAL